MRPTRVVAAELDRRIGASRFPRFSSAKGSTLRAPSRRGSGASRASSCRAPALAEKRRARDGIAHQARGADAGTGASHASSGEQAAKTIPLPRTMRPAESVSSRPCSANGAGSRQAVQSTSPQRLIAGKPSSDHSKTARGVAGGVEPRGRAAQGRRRKEPRVVLVEPSREERDGPLAIDDRLVMGLAADRVAVVDRRVDRGRQAAALPRLCSAQASRLPSA